MKLEIRLFRFNAKHDYLPSYQPFVFKATADQTLLDLLNFHKQKDPLFVCNLSNVYGAKVNGYTCTLQTKLFDLATTLGSDLQIEPLDTARATLDLEIDTTDFDDIFLQFSDFVSGNDGVFYNQFIIHHYASTARKIVPNYLGVAGFMLANKLLETNPANSNALREIVKKGKIDSYDGTKAVFVGSTEVDRTITELQANLGFEPRSFTALNADQSDKFAGKTVVLVSEKTACIEYEKALVASGAKLVKTAPLGSGYLLHNLENARAVASLLITEAFDQGADAVVCAEKEVYEFLSKEFKNITKLIRQEIILEVVSF